MIVVGGRDLRTYLSDRVEIVSQALDCHVDPFPMEVTEAKGFNGMICGGKAADHSSQASCWSLKPNGSWAHEADMNRKRNGFSLTLFHNHTLYAIGGSDTANPDMKDWFDLATVEKYSVDDGRPSHWIQLEKAPFTIALHCAVAFDSYLWLIGGQHHYDGLLDNYSLGTESIKRKVGTFILQAYFKNSLVKT